MILIPNLNAPHINQAIIIPGVVKVELLTDANRNLNNKTNSWSSYGDIFADQLRVTLSLNTNRVKLRAGSPYLESRL